MNALGGTVTPTEVVALITTTAVVLGALVVIWKAVRRFRSGAQGVVADAVKIRDSINGRPAVLDTITGAEISRALPGIGQRMDTVERAVATLADQHRVLDDHEDRLKALEAAAVERIVTRSESAQAWRAMTAATLATPAEQDDP